MSYGGILNQSGAGTYTAEEILPDSLKLQYGLSESAVPADVFENILMRFEMANRNAGLVNVYIHDTAGNPLPGVIINNLTSIDNSTVITNENGKASGFASAGSVTVGVSQYADIENVSQVISVEVGKVYSVELTATTRNFLRITSTGNYRFSENVRRADVNPVGGGGGGNHFSPIGDSDIAAGAGGGGGDVVIQENVNFEYNVLYQAIVGNGGPVMQAGGASSFLNVIAEGGQPGERGPNSSQQAIGGSGNGKGGNGGNTNSTEIGGVGVAGNKQGFASFTETELFSGGGGGGTAKNTGTVTAGGAGGSPFGGRGGNASNSIDTVVNAENGKGFGGGGGGAGAFIRRGNSIPSLSYPGSGYQGCINLRMHLKTA